MFIRARLLRSPELLPEMEGKRSFVRQGGIARRRARAEGRPSTNGGRQGGRWQPTRPRRESETFCLSRLRGRRHRRGNACATPSPASFARPLPQSEVHGKQTIGNSDGRRGRQLVTNPVLKSCVLGNGTEWMHAPPRPRLTSSGGLHIVSEKPGQRARERGGEGALVACSASRLASPMIPIIAISH